MKRSVRVILWAVVAAAVALPVAIHLAKGPILRVVTVRLVEAATGFGVELERAEVRFLARTADFHGLHLLNPAGFAEREAVEIRRLHVETTWKSLWEEKPWFKKLEIDIPRIVLVRPRRGRSNLELLGDNLEAWKSASALVPSRGGPRPTGVGRLARRPAWRGLSARTTRSAETAASAVEADLRIDELRLRLGEITVIDYLLGRDGPVTVRRTIDQERVYHHVTDLDELSEELVIDFAVDAIMAGIGELEDLGPELREGIKEMIRRPPEESGPRPPAEIEDAVDLFKDILDQR